MWELFEKGGELMYPILGASMFGLAVIIERWIVISRTKVPSAKEMRGIIQAALAGENGTTGVGALLDQSNTPVHQVMRAVWRTPGDHVVREKAAGIVGDQVLLKLNRRLSWLAVLGSLVPLMGLLGTVVGMIRVFSRVAQAGDVSDITLLAGGIWEALLTTAAGLTVSLPILFAYHFLQGKVDHVAHEMRRWGEELIVVIGGRAPAAVSETGKS